MDKIIKRKSWVNRNKYSAIGAMFVLSIVIYQIAFADHSSKFKVDADKISINEIQDSHSASLSLFYYISYL